MSLKLIDCTKLPKKGELACDFCLRLRTRCPGQKLIEGEHKGAVVHICATCLRDGSRMIDDYDAVKRGG